MSKVVARRRRPSNGRAVASWTLVVIGLVVVGLVTGVAQADDVEEVDHATLNRGAEVYAVTCAACHGADGGGLDGPEGDVTAGPSIVGVDIALVDQLVRTGRMPIVDREAGVGGDAEDLAAEHREAMVAWMDEAFDLTGEIPDVDEGDVSSGHELYTQHCASCHGSTGEGGVSGDGTVVRGVQDLDRVAVVEAIRAGPIGMPRFEEAALDDSEAADIGTYVEQELVSASGTPLGLDEMNRPTMWLMATLLVLVALLLVRLVGAGPRIPRPAVTGESGDDEDRGDAQHTAPRHDPRDDRDGDSPR